MGISAAGRLLTLSGDSLDVLRHHQVDVLVEAALLTAARRPSTTPGSSGGKGESGEFGREGAGGGGEDGRTERVERAHQKNRRSGDEEADRKIFFDAPRRGAFRDLW